MAESRKITVSKTKIGEYVDPQARSDRDARPWDVVEVVEVWHQLNTRVRGYYLHVSVWRERHIQEGPYSVTETMIGVGHSGVRELLEQATRFNQKRAAYWAGVVLNDPRLPAMKDRIKDLQVVR